MNKRLIKGIRKSIKILLSMLIVILTLVSCEEAATDKDWGFSLLYMPQAVLQSGGSNNNYYVEVDSSNNSDTTIIVGIYRSGLEPVEPVTVDLVVDTDTLSYLINEANKPDADSKFSLYKNAEVLDQEHYEIPSTLSLEKGQRDNYDYIILHKDLLWEDDSPNDTPFILPLRIQNPSRYKLNESLSITLFVFTRNK